MIRLSDVRYTLRMWRRHPGMIAVTKLVKELSDGVRSVAKRAAA